MKEKHFEPGTILPPCLHVTLRNLPHNPLARSTDAIAPRRNESEVLQSTRFDADGDLKLDRSSPCPMAHIQALKNGNTQLLTDGLKDIMKAVLLRDELSQGLPWR